MATLIVKNKNPGELKIKIDDEALLQLFTDMALCKNSLGLLWKVVLGGMTGGFGLITALIVLL